MLKGMDTLIQLQEVEGVRAGGLAVVEVEDQNGHQHQQGAEHGEQEELDGRIDPAGRVAPNPDEQVHGDEHHFPEDVEQEEVQGDEDADHAGHQGQQADHEFLDPDLDVVPGGQDAQRGEEGGEHDEQQGKAVDPHVVADTVSRQPLPALHELHGRGLAVEVKPEGQGNQELHHGDGQGGDLQALVALPVQDQQDPYPDDGEENQNGEDG